MPIFRLSRAFSIGRNAKIFLNLQGGLTRGTVPDPDHELKKQRKRLERRAEELKNVRQHNEKQRGELLKQKLENSQLRNELDTINEFIENNQNSPSATRVSGKLEIGTLPDFVVIGAQRCGTSKFYDLLTQHPSVEHAAVKEVHYFDELRRFNKGSEWYRRCFPAPKWKEGRRSITGEATPKYFTDPLVPERMARVVPEARLIVLLRDPVNRAYSAYRLLARRRQVTQSFEEIIEAEQAWLLGEENQFSEHERHLTDRHGRPFNLLLTGIYVDHILRWRRFFSDEQILVLKSENFYGHTIETLKLVQGFLGLPYWELDLQSHKTPYVYEPMAPATRRRLEDFFESHNQRLYEYLGVDFEW